MSVEPFNSSGQGASSPLRHPLTLAVVFVAVSLVAIVGCLRAKLDASLDLLMARDSAAIVAQQSYLQVVREFGSDVRSYFLVREERWTPEKLDALEKLHDELAGLAFVERVEDVFSMVVVRDHEGQLMSAPLLRSRAHGQPADLVATPESLRSLTGDARPVRHLVGTKGQSLVLGAALREDAQAVQDGSAQAALTVLATRYREIFPSLIVFGPQEIETAFRESALHDLYWLGGAAICTLLFVVPLLTRSLRATLLATGLFAAGLVWTLGLMGFLGVTANLLTGSAVMLIAAIGSVRVVRPCVQIAAVPDSSGVQALQVLRFDGAAWSACLIVAVGLLVQGFTGIAAVRELLFVIALAFATTWVAGLLASPMLARLLVSRQQARKRAGFARAVAAASGAVVEPLARHGVVVAIAAMLALASMLAFLVVRGVHVEHVPLALLGAENPVANAAQRLHEEIVGPGIFYIRLDAYAKGAFRDPANLQRLADIQAFIDKQKVFDGSASLADFVAQAHQEASGGHGGASVQLPVNRRLIEQYLVLLHPETVSPYVSNDFSRAVIVVRHGLHDASVLAEHVRELRVVAAQVAGPAMTTQIAGRELLIGESIHLIAKFGVLTAVAVLLTVFVVLSLMFTSLLGGGIAAVSSFLPLLMAMVVMRLLDIPVSLVTATGAVLPVMVSVLTTVRLFSTYSECCRRAEAGESPVMAAVGRELGSTFAMVLVCFAAACCLLLSQFAVLRHLGAFLGLAFAGTALTALFFVPVALSRMRLVSLYDILAMSGRGKDLAASPLFAGFSSYQMRKTILLSDLREFSNGACVIEQGSVDNSMYLVLSGKVEVVRRGEDGERLLATLGAGEVFGEIGFVRETYRTADVRAIGEVAVLRFDYQRLRHDLMLFPNIMAKLNFNICGILGKRLAETVGKPGQ